MGEMKGVSRKAVIIIYNFIGNADKLITICVRGFDKIKEKWSSVQVKVVALEEREMDLI